MAKIRISVTEKDILNGRKGNCSFCPVANAITRLFVNNPPLIAVKVSYSAFSLKVDLVIGSEIQVPIPYKAEYRIRRFDLPDSKMEPFNFIVNIPSEFLTRYYFVFADNVLNDIVIISE